MSEVIIVGGGISGLTVAFRLQQLMPEATITVLEKEPRLGGTIRTDERDGFRVEAGPNGFLDSKPSTKQLCEDLGIHRHLVAGSEAASKNRYLFLGEGHLRKLPTGFGSFLRSGLLSWRGKLSLMMERFRRPAMELSDESIDSFTRRRAGNEAADLLADAMVTGIYAGDPSLLSVQASFPRLATLEKEHGSVLKGMAKAAKEKRKEAKARGETPRRPDLLSFQNGLTFLIEILRERLKTPAEVGVSVSRILRENQDNAGQRWRVFSEDGRNWQADSVVLTCPAHQQADMVSELDAKLAEEIRGIPYNRVVVVGMGYRKNDVPMSIDGFGYIAPQRLQRDLLGVQWCSSIYPDRAPEDAVLLRALAGGWHRADILDWDDERLIRAVREELRQAMHITSEPIFTHIVRWPRAIPQYHLGHLDRVDAINTRVGSHPGLFLAGNAYHGVALNDCTEQGQVLAEKVKEYLGREEIPA
ncbi:MAG: protoporphyrinogen oxidase [Gemmataceae bacterium]